LIFEPLEMTIIVVIDDTIFVKMGVVFYLFIYLRPGTKAWLLNPYATR
jgi:hypothetical protein